MIDGITCGECGYYAHSDPAIGVDHRRTYDGQDVCVSCYTDLKLENGGYE